MWFGREGLSLAGRVLWTVTMVTVVYEVSQLARVIDTTFNSHALHHEVNMSTTEVNGD
jgi:hypothetical protein